MGSAARPGLMTRPSSFSTRPAWYRPGRWRASSKLSIASGAKLVLVGDPEQLQPIEAGAAFRAIAERIGYAELGRSIASANSGCAMPRSIWRVEISAALDAYADRAIWCGLVGLRRSDRRLIADWDREYDPVKAT
jgi:hypothetical protein